MEANSNTDHTGETARQAARSKLMQDLNAVIGDAEQWLKNSALQDNGKADNSEGAARDAFLAALNTAKTDMLKMQSTALARGRLAARATDDYVNGHPWAAVAVGAAAGMLLGLLLSRTER